MLDVGWYCATYSRVIVLAKQREHRSHSLDIHDSIKGPSLSALVTYVRRTLTGVAVQVLLFVFRPGCLQGR